MNASTRIAVLASVLILCALPARADRPSQLEVDLELVKDLTDQLRANPDDVGAHYALALYAYEAGHLAEALDHFRAVASRHTKDIPSRVYMAMALEQLGRFSEAESAAQEVLAIDPRHSRAQALLAEIRKAKRERAEMIGPETPLVRPALRKDGAPTRVSIPALGAVERPASSAVKLPASPDRSPGMALPGLAVPGEPEFQSFSRPGGVFGRINEQIQKSERTVEDVEKLAEEFLNRLRQSETGLNRMLETRMLMEKRLERIYQTHLADREREIEKLRGRLEAIEDQLKVAIGEYGPLEQVPANAVNLNTASAKELMALPNVDQKLAENILWYRQNVGPFLSPRDLMYVPGMSDETYARLVGKVVTLN